MIWRSAVMAAVLAMGLALPAKAQQAPTMQNTISAEDWSAYKSRFLDPSGRIIDTANGGISHSEGQGYGLMLALMADSEPDFDQIWSFTRTQLLLRDDGLAFWKWDPTANPPVTDPNNASDGDILIAYALLRAGQAWERSDLSDAATGIIAALASKTIIRVQGSPTLLPAAQGFGAKDREDGPVVNPSYWVFEAFPAFAAVNKGTDWLAVAQSGGTLLRSAAFGIGKLPSDWISIERRPKPAAGFPPEFGYNAIRIPLYLIRAGMTDPALLQPYDTGTLAVVDVANNDTKAELTEPGYRIIPALVACALRKVRVPDDLRRFVPTDYYPSTLHLLAISHLNANPGECG